MASLAHAKCLESLDQNGLHRRLPVELEHLIVDRFIEGKMPSEFVSLRLVCKSFDLWITPEMYRVVVCVDNGEPYRNYPPIFAPGSKEVLSSTFLQHSHRTQHLLIHRTVAHGACLILKYCQNVQNLALWLIRGRGDRILETLRTLHDLRWLSANLRWLQFPADQISAYPAYDETDPSFEFDHTAFPQLSRLDIICLLPEEGWNPWKNLALLPNLTHVELEGFDCMDIVKELLECCARIQNVILVSHTEISHRGYHLSEAECAELVADPRVIQRPDVPDPLRIWLEGTRGGVDLWDYR